MRIPRSVHCVRTGERGSLAASARVLEAVRDSCRRSGAAFGPTRPPTENPLAHLFSAPYVAARRGGSPPWGHRTSPQNETRGPMAHRVDPGRSWARVRSLTGVAVALSLLFVSVAEASHSHEGTAELAAACSVCQLEHTPGYTTGSNVPGVTGPNPLRAPAPLRYRSQPPTTHLAPKRSRAPPLSTSL